MSEQTPGPGTGPEPDKPAVGGPDGAATEDWQQRFEQVNQSYSNLQPEYTRVTQERDQLRDALYWHELLLTSEDPDVRQQAADALGIEFEQEEQPQPAGEDRDPLEPLDARLTALETRDQQRENQKQEDEQVRALLDAFGTQLEELIPGASHPDRDVAEGVKFDQDQVLAYALNALPPLEDGSPNIPLAHQLWLQRNDARLQAWAHTKRAPMFSPDGQSATEAPDLDNDQERQDYMTRRLMSNLEP